MGLDIYVGPVTRYVAGDWLTVFHQQRAASGAPADAVYLSEPSALVEDLSLVEIAVAEWQARLLESLHVDAGAWIEAADLPYATDHPDWDGYGAVLLLAAIDEHPHLAPGGSVRHGLRKTPLPEVPPRRFADAEAFRTASAAPHRYPILLGGTEWCLPIGEGAAVFHAPTPNGTRLTMGRVDRLVDELHLLNDRTLRLSSDDRSATRQAGLPPAPASVDDAAPFGLAVLLGLAEHALANTTAWIMDY